MADEKLKMAEDLKNSSYGLGVRHLQAVMMCWCTMVIYVTRSSMGPAILAMTDNSHANQTNIEIYEWTGEIRGVVLSSFYWGYTVMQIPAGVLCKKFGGKPLLLNALVVNGLLCLATPSLAKIGGWVAVCAVRVMMGLTQACLMPAGHTLLGRWAPPNERTRISILVYAGVQLGTILTMPLCGVLSNTSLGWHMIFYSMGGLALTTALFWWGLTGSSPREHRLIKEEELYYIEKSLNSRTEDKNPTPWKQIFTSVPLLAIFIANTGINWCFVLFLVQIPTYLKNALGINLSDSASLSALPFVAQWLTMSLCSFISDYLYSHKYLSLTSCRKLFNSIGTIGAGAGLIAIAFISSEHKEYAISVLISTVGLLGVANCGSNLNHIDLSPKFAGILLSLTNCGSNLIGILAPLSTGFILGDSPNDISRWRIVFLTGASIVISSDIIYRIFGSSELQPWNDSTAYQRGVAENNKKQEAEGKYYFPEKVNEKCAL